MLKKKAIEDNDFSNSSLSDLVIVKSGPRPVNLHGYCGPVNQNAKL